MERNKLVEKKSQINPRFFIEKNEAKAKKTLGALIAGIGLLGSLSGGYNEENKLKGEQDGKRR